MKVLGLVKESHPVHKQLVNYTLSLFKQVSTDVVGFQIEKGINNMEITPSKSVKNNSLSNLVYDSSLLILAINIEHGAYKNTFETIYREQCSQVHKKPLLLLVLSEKNKDIKSIVDLMMRELQEVGVNNVETYVLPHYVKNFDGSEILDIRLKLDLIRTVNRMMYNQLSLRDNSYFTCGIDARRDYCGDAIEY